LSDAGAADFMGHLARRLDAVIDPARLRVARAAYGLLIS
jgi:hypothetical protein